MDGQRRVKTLPSRRTTYAGGNSEFINLVVFAALPAPITIDKAHFRECLLEALSEMFGPECISPLIRGDKMSVTVDDKTALIDLNTLVGTLFNYFLNYLFNFML